MKSKNKSVEDRSKAFEETMHDIFYNKAIRQRDSAWREIEELKDTIKELETKLKEIRNINDPWILVNDELPKVEQWYEVTYYVPVNEVRTYCMYFYNGKFYDSEQDARESHESFSDRSVPFGELIAWKYPTPPYGVSSIIDKNKKDRLLPKVKVKWYGANYKHESVYEPVPDQDTKHYDAVLSTFHGDGEYTTFLPPFEYWTIRFSNGDKVLRPVLKKIRPEVLDNLNNVSYNINVNDDTGG